MENLLEGILDSHSVWAPPRLLHERSLWVVEHTCAEAHTTIVALEDIVVAATLATLPELVILSELRECHRLVAEAGVQLHYRKRCCNTEQLCKWEAQACQLEGTLLDLARQTEVAILGVYDESRCSNVVAVSPALDVAEADELVSCERNHSLAACNLRSDILRRTASNTSTTLQGRDDDTRGLR